MVACYIGSNVPIGQSDGNVAARRRVAPWTMLHAKHQFRDMRKLLCLVVTLVVSLAATARAQRPSVTVDVQVRDTAGAGIAGVEVSLVRGLNDTRASSTTDARGRALLRFAESDTGADVQLIARKIGYQRGDRFFHASRDSLVFELILRRSVQELAPVIVSAEEDVKRKAYHIDADAIASSTANLIDATDILAKLRPDMICGRDCRPMAGIAARTSNPLRACPRLQFMDAPPRSCPASDALESIETNVWVNGRRIRIMPPDEAVVARQHGILAGLSKPSMTVLSEIKPEHIAEMTYVDQFDHSVGKIGSEGGLFVVLKPGVVYEPGKDTYVQAVATSDEHRSSATLPPYRYRVLGVFDMETGEPIAGAVVTDMQTGTHAETTATGTVTLIFLPEGGSPVRISKPGYQDLTLAVEIAADQTLPMTLVMSKRPR